MKVEALEVEDEVAAKVIEYVYANYKGLKDKPLVIKEGKGCFYVFKHKDEGPMILGKGIIS